MTLREFDACLRGFLRANGATDDATQDDYDDYLAALAEAERAGLT